MKINENKAIATSCKRLSTSTQKFKRPDLVFESVNPETGKMKWELVEITCPWPWIDYDGETLEKAYRKKAGKYDVLRADLAREYPNQEVEQTAIVVGATGVFHKRSQLEFARVARVTRLQKKDLARWQRNVVDMAIHGSYQIFHESMEKAKFNQKNPPPPEVVEIIEMDLEPDADEEPVRIGTELDLDELTAIETYQASVQAREAALMEGRAAPEIKEHPDGHKDPERLKSARRDLDRLLTMRRAVRNHETFAAIDSVGQYKQTRVLRRSPSADDITHSDVTADQPAQITITLCAGGNREHEISVSERTSLDELRRIVSTEAGGRCVVEPDQFPLKNGTEVRVIPVFVPDGRNVDDKDLVVPYLKYKEHYRPIATLPDAPIELSAAIAADYMNQQCMVTIPRRPIRSGDEIVMITAGDIQIKQEAKLQALREEDKVILPPVKPRPPPTMQQVLNQSAPRAHSREILAPWEIAKPELAAREQVLVILELQNAIQEPSTRKAFITRRKDDTWEKAAQRAFGFPIKFDTEVQSVEENQVLPCLVDFEEQEPRQSKEGSIHISPRTPLSFPIGIKAMFNDQTADITIQNNTPVARVEAILSMRWGVQVQFAPNQSLVWAPNKRFEFVSTMPGQRAALTEEMRARLAEETSSRKWRMTLTVVDGWSRYPVELIADTSMSWEQILGPWYQ
jgi:hypothetical protein